MYLIGDIGNTEVKICVYAKDKKLLDKNSYWPPKRSKHSINVPFLKVDLPLLNKAQVFALVNDLILKDSWPFKTSTSKVPFLFVDTLAFKNFVKL